MEHITFEDSRRTNYSPPTSVLVTVQEGEHVKVCHNAERFWVKVTENDTESSSISGTVANDLVNEQPFGFGDAVTFEYFHVYQVMR